jgi:hypothetical protein
MGGKIRKKQWKRLAKLLEKRNSVLKSWIYDLQKEIRRQYGR